MTISSFIHEVSDNPIEVLTSDLCRTIKDGNQAAANDIIKKIKSFLIQNEVLNFQNASKWVEEEAEEPDQIIQNLLDVGDKLAIIASSKVKKSMLTLQFCLCAAIGKSFIGLNIQKPRRVIYIQFEIKKNHCHLRLKRLCRALGIEADELKDNLWILNARGLGLTGAEGIERIKAGIQEYRPEQIVFDPLYKIATGVENAAEDTKAILSCFDSLAEETGAAIAYVHHDAKGTPGDRNIQDRGAGSNVLGRDYDACLVMTEHAEEPDAVVLDVLQRNYAPIEPFTIQWTNDGDGYCFRRADEIIPDKKTSRSKPAPPPVSTYYPAAEEILESGEMDVRLFKVHFKEKTGLSVHRIRAFMTWAEDPKEPRFLTNETRGKGKHIKTIRLAKYED